MDIGVIKNKWWVAVLVGQLQSEKQMYHFKDYIVINKYLHKLSYQQLFLSSDAFEEKQLQPR